MYIVGRNIAKDGEKFSCYQEALHSTQAQAVEDYRQRERRGDSGLFLAKMYTIKIKINLIDPDKESEDTER